PNWEAEARRFVPSLRVARRSATEPKSTSTVAEDAATHDIVVTSSTVLRLDADSYSGIEWAGVFLDEAQQAKNPSSKLFASLAGLRADFLVAVTGTPMENNLTELWAVATLSCRGVLPDAKEFRSQFRTPIEKHGDGEALDRLRRRLRPFLLRRRKELVAGELPPRTDAVVEVELTAAHRRVYERELARQRASLLALLDDFESNRITILAGLTVLRRLCLDPSLVDPEHASIPSAKTDELIVSLREVVDEGHRALVFSQYTTYLDTVVDRLRDEGISVAHLDGKTTDRAGAVGARGAGRRPRAPDRPDPAGAGVPHGRARHDRGARGGVAAAQGRAVRLGPGQWRALLRRPHCRRPARAARLGSADPGQREAG